MKIKGFQMSEKIKPSFIKYKMTKRDKRLLIESVLLIVIYVLSFVILSLGRVQQTFLGISEATFSNIQMITLTFILAVILTLVLYYIYKKTIK
jgi:hypothetical protein